MNNYEYWSAMNEARGMRLADQFFSAEARQGFSADMIEGIGKTFRKQCRNPKIGEGFYKMACLVARQDRFKE